MKFKINRLLDEAEKLLTLLPADFIVPYQEIAQKISETQIVDATLTLRNARRKLSKQARSFKPYPNLSDRFSSFFGDLILFCLDAQNARMEKRSSIAMELLATLHYANAA